MTDIVAKNPQVTYTYKQNNLRTTLVIYFFALFALTATTLITLTFVIYSKLNLFVQDGPDGQSTLIALTKLYDHLNQGFYIIFIICAITFLFWLYRASVNAHALNPQIKFKYSPGWTVGSYFIPLLNLLWPWYSMDEIWHASGYPKKTIITIWWLTFIFMNAFANLSARQAKINSIADLKSFLIFNSLPCFLGLISAVFAIIIVRKINVVQNANRVN